MTLIVSRHSFFSLQDYCLMPHKTQRSQIVCSMIPSPWMSSWVLESTAWRYRCLPWDDIRWSPFWEKHLNPKSNDYTWLTILFFHWLLFHRIVGKDSCSQELLSSISYFPKIRRQRETRGYWLWKYTLFSFVLWSSSFLCSWKSLPWSWFSQHSMMTNHCFQRVILQQKNWQWLPFPQHVSPKLQVICWVTSFDYWNTCSLKR